MGWLAEEAALRYQALCQRRPKLSLTTSDGALLAQDDLVADLLQNDEVVRGEEKGGLREV